MNQLSPEIIQQHGLTPDEYQGIVKILGREPNLLELGIFSVMWSEHCSYKSSKIYLKELPTKGPQVLCGPGENAGIVDIGDGLAVVFKIESHNHPSYIEPYQGAATGVGGILRDVFTMGARPIALLNSLRFGSPSHPKTKSLVSGVVAGIGGYGNSIGIPTVGGEVYFDECYNGNILVNAMCVGLIEKDKIFLAKASGVGNPVIYVGSKTGRDGIHGATMASDVFDEESESKRPTVQVGDPFTEKLLMEACLELMQSKKGREAIAGIQDMGAAGLTCSSVEMSGKGDVGMELNLEKVPLRETGMTPYEIMLSESQERMFLVANKGHENEIMKVFKKWDLDAAEVGVVTQGHEVTIRMNGKVQGVVPNQPISEEAPVYKRPLRKPHPPVPLSLTKRGGDEVEILLRLLSSPNIASKKWVYRQYDQMVGTNTIVLPGSDSAVVRIRGTKKALAITTDCNSRYCYLDPREGARIAVAEAARNIVCSGGKPLAVTNCLNFGSPEEPEIMWQFKEAVEGMAEACREFQTPIVSGNVSFYNQSQEGSIYPTPVIGMIGLLDDVNHHCTQWFKEEGDVIVLIGPPAQNDLGGSEYLKVIENQVAGTPPTLDLELEKKVQSVVLKAIQKGWLQSAHDCSEGGLAVALAECCISGPAPLGAEIDPLSYLFAETQSRVVVSVKENDLQSLLDLAKREGSPAEVIGKTGGAQLTIGSTVSLSCQQLEEAWKGGFEKCVGL